MDVDYGVLHSLVSIIMSVDIELRDRHICHLGEDIPVNSEFSKLWGHLNIEIVGWGGLAAS